MIESISIKSINNQLTKQMKNKLPKTKHICLQEGDYVVYKQSQQNVDVQLKYQLFSEQSYPCQIIELGFNSYSHIIKDLSIYRFHALKQLILNNNQITSIQIIQNISMPNLIELNLNANLITQLRSLRKCQITKIDWLMISENYINELTTLSELKSTKLGALTLQRLYDCNQPQCQNQGLQHILKFQTKSLTNLYIAAQNRKKCPSIDIQLIHKYKTIQIRRLNKRQQFEYAAM